MINFKTIQQSSIIFIVTFLCAFSLSAYATEFHVTTSQELQTALSTAAENNQSDSIFLAAGTYKGNFRFETEESDTSISIQAEEGLNAGNVILDGEERDRVLSINSGENKVNVNIDRLTIQNGKNNSCGGLYVISVGEVNVYYSHIINNYAGSSTGGCLITSSNKVSIIKTVFNNNIGANYSGLRVVSDDVKIEGNEFSNNDCWYSGNENPGCVSINGTNIMSKTIYLNKMKG